MISDADRARWIEGDRRRRVDDGLDPDHVTDLGALEIVAAVISAERPRAAS